MPILQALEITKTHIQNLQILSTEHPADILYENSGENFADQ